MLRAILVDDEPVILEKLKSMLAGNEELEVVGTYTNPLEALENAALVRPDCAFLDIEMAGLSGIELAELLASLNPDIAVVFITAYNHYASQAFEVNAMDYLLKPVRPERLEKAVIKLCEKIFRVPQTQESTCVIRCFGAFEVIASGRTIKWSRSRSRELLAYLLQNEGRWLSKYKLCDELWMDSPPERALAYLQICLHALRKTLREAGCTQLEIEYSSDRYILRLKEADWDLRKFETAYNEYLRTGSAEAAERALRYGGGEYLEGEDWPWSDLAREAYVCMHDKLKEALGN